MTATTIRPAPSLRRTRGLAVGGAVLATGTLYVAAHALGTGFVLTDPGKAAEHQLILPEIAVLTLVFALLGWGTLALLEHFTRRARAAWTTLAGAVLALSFVPIALEQASTSTKVMLTLIHIAVAAVIVPAFRPGAHTEEY
jgi:hypothetical protein